MSPAASADFIFSRDDSGNVNTGVGFVRNSPTSIEVLELVVEMQRTLHHYGRKIAHWEHNGAQTPCARRVPAHALTYTFNRCDS